MTVKALGSWKRRAVSTNLRWLSRMRSRPTLTSSNLMSPGSRQASTSKKPFSVPPFSSWSRKPGVAQMTLERRHPHAVPPIVPQMINDGQFGTGPLPAD